MPVISPHELPMKARFGPQQQVEGKATIQRIEFTYSDGSIWAMGPPVARAKKAAKVKTRKDDGVKVMVPLL